jgi:hypothetical protein
VFHIPGPIFRPDYDGVHATRLDPKNNRVVVAAVPPNLRFDEVSKYVRDVLGQARDEAEQYLCKLRIIRGQTTSGC